MHILHTSALPLPATHLQAATAKPCIRDYSELVTTVVPEPIAQLVPLAELQRRLAEVVRTRPRFAEEAPLYYRNEVRRRAAFAGPHLR